MAWCHQATSPNLNQCLQSHPMSYDVTKQQWFKHKINCPESTPIFDNLNVSDELLQFILEILCFQFVSITISTAAAIIPVHALVMILACRIKTGHSNLVSCFGPRMRALAKVFYRGISRGKIPYQSPNPRAKTWHKIWMTGLNPNYDTIPIPSLQNSQNKCQESSFIYDRRHHLILPLPPVHTLPTLNARTCC